MCGHSHIPLGLSSQPYPTPMMCAAGEGAAAAVLDASEQKTLLAGVGAEGWVLVAGDGVS